MVFPVVAEPGILPFQGEEAGQRALRSLWKHQAPLGPLSSTSSAFQSGFSMATLGSARERVSGEFQGHCFTLTPTDLDLCCLGKAAEAAGPPPARSPFQASLSCVRREMQAGCCGRPDGGLGVRQPSSGAPLPASQVPGGWAPCTCLHLSAV